MEKDLTDNQFNKVFAIVFVGILIFISILLFVNLNLGFKLKGIKGDKNKIDIFDSSVQIEFKTPIDFGQNATGSDEVPNLKNYISIVPNVDFSINVTGSTLTLNFKDILDSDATYKIKLDKNLTDIYGNSLGKDRQLEFKTRVNTLSYVERIEGQVDKLVHTDVNLENRKVIYENSKDKIISTFSSNHNFYALIIENDDGTNNIKVINKKTNEIVDLDLKDRKVKNVNLFRNSNRLIYVSYEVENKGKFLAPKGFSEITLYDANSKSLTKLDFKDRIIEPSELTIAPDDKSILFQNDFDSEYYIFDITNPDTIISIGRQLESGGFNKDGNLITFVNYDPSIPNITYPYISIYSSERDELKIPGTVEFAMDPKFFNRTDAVIFSERWKELEGSKGIFSIMLYTDEVTTTYLLIEASDKSLEAPKPSPDDRYLVIETFTKEQLLDFSKQRQYEFQTKPFRGSLMIYDLFERKTITDNLSGVNAIWDY